MKEVEQFDQWCLVEMMGHQRIAGKVTEKVIAGQGFLQVDVPETSRNPAFTRFVSPGSLYALNPIDEATARWYAENLQVKPIESWDINAFMKKAEAHKQLTAAASRNGLEDNESDEEDEDQ